MPFETLKRGDPKIQAWDGVSYGSSEYHGLGPGQWTDDTSMALAISTALLAEKGFNPRLIADHYVDWYKSPSFKGAGRTTKKALQDLSTGCPWVHSGVEGAEGNGPAMRIAPLGLYYHRISLKAVARLAATEAEITHDSDVARDGAIAVALGVALLARKEENPQSVAYKVADQLQTIGSNDGHNIMGYRMHKAYQKSRHPTGDPEEVLAGIGTSPHILQTVPAAFYALAKGTNFKETVELAIRAGGDTDTTAAIAGALAGTYYGVGQVAQFLPNLHEGERLRDQERRLYTEGPKVEGPADWK